MRLHLHADFDRVFKTGLRSADPVFRVYAFAASGSEARLGLSVSRSVAARATARNRIKRLVRESFRQNRQTLPPVDIVVQALPVAARTQNPGLRSSLEWHWQQLVKRCAAS
ncbi:MAG: ribonuclease P protein component [Gammaproteobacteria bacterium]